MAIWQIELENRDSEKFRRRMSRHGFSSAHYFSSNGFNIRKLREMAKAGELDAIRCIVGNSVRWYYAEAQAEFAKLKGKVN